MLADPVGLRIISPAWLGHQDRPDIPAEQFGDQPNQVVPVAIQGQPAGRLSLVNIAVVGAVHDRDHVRLQRHDVSRPRQWAIVTADRTGGGQQANRDDHGRPAPPHRADRMRHITDGYRHEGP